MLSIKVICRYQPQVTITHAALPNCENIFVVALAYFVSA